MEIKTTSGAKRRRLPSLAFAMSSAAAIGLLVGLNAVPTSHAETQATPATNAAPWAGYADLIEEIMPSVVTVTTSRNAEENGEDGAAPFGPGGPSDEQMRRFMERFFGEGGRRGMPPMPRGPMVGAGSGFIIDQEGHVVTNNHVIENADEVMVMLHDDRELEAEVIGTDPDTDLALLKIEAEGDLPVASFADSDAARVGDAVIAIGNPFGLGGTVTAGIISAKAREIGAGRYDDFLQIDAPINRGNSGGPTFNLEGEVIGVNTAIHSPSGGNVGIGFAIPANLADKIIADLKDDGEVDRGWLGVHIQPVDDDLASSLGLEKAEGALVARVFDDSPASAAGIEAGDVILDYDGKAIASLRDLTRAVADTEPGKEAEVVLWRDEEETTLAIEIQNMPDQEDLAMTTPEEEEDVEGEATPRLGVALAKLDDETRSSMDLDEGTSGVVVTEVVPGSPAEEKGLRRGDLILEADQQKVESPDAVIDAVQGVAERGEDAVLLLIKRGDQDRFVAVKIEQA